MNAPSSAAGRILVVDDQENLCWILSRLLAQRGHGIRTALTGGAALAALEDFDCQVAVVDFRLPDTDGLSLIERLRLRRPALRAILMTSYGSRSLEEDVLAGQVFAYFNKPFNNVLLIQTVEEALRAGEWGADSSRRGMDSPTRFPARSGGR